MKHFLKRFVAATFCVALASTAAHADDKFAFIDLSSHMNRDLMENLSGEGSTNSLLKLPTGDQTFAGIKFHVGPGMIQLGGRDIRAFPEKVEGIAVDRKFKTLHILHSTHYGRGKRGDAWYIDDGVEIGQYLVHYDDGSKQEIPIIYGEDVRDWYFSDGEKGPTRGKVAWKGDNEVATKIGARLRLYLSSWKNPKPDMKITRIDFINSKGESIAAPFCIALTAE